MKAELLKRLREIRILESGRFVLQNAGKSAFYVDVKKAYGYPDILNGISDALWAGIDKSTTCIASSGHGGISPASVISAKYGLNLTLIRDGFKNHGRRDIIDGYIPGQEDKVSIVDDVFTTGGGLLHMIGVLTPLDCRILGCHVVVKRSRREFSSPLHYLFSLEDLAGNGPDGI